MSGINNELAAQEAAITRKKVDSEKAMKRAESPHKNIREEVLLTANTYVNKDRQATHGKPENTFATHAALWSAYLGVTITDVDVANMMVLFKIGRAKENKTVLENYIDAAGYAACGAELANKENS